MDEINFTINEIKVKGSPGNTIIDVAQNYGIPIPTLCHDPDLHSIGACRVCLVEDEKRGTLLASCVTPISDGMSIRTDSKKVIETRRVVVKLMMAAHPESCIVCSKGNRCKLRQIAADLGIGRVEYYPMPNYTGTQEVNPFILRDLSKCILCARCIRADHELVVEGAIDYIDRGFEARPATITDGPLELSECTFCGTCVEMCPTGALFEKDKRFRSTSSQRVPTTCSFCGCGCSFWLEVSNNQVVGVRPGISGSTNGSTLCVKGHYGYDFINRPDRLTKPIIRKDDSLEETSWDEALKTAVEGLKSIKEQYGGESLAFLTGSHCTNEEAFLINRFANDVLNTDQVICNSSNFMSNLIQGMEETLGFIGTNGSIKDLEDAEAILLIGANPTETAPIAGYSIKRGVREKNTALIVIDPVEIKLTKHANLWLQPLINTDEFLLLGFLNVLLENKNFKKGLTGSNDKKIQELIKKIKKISIDNVEQKTGVSFERLKEAVQVFCSAGKRAIVFGDGIIQQPAGKNLVKILCTIGSLTGIINKNKTLFLPIIKQSNALGSLHMGLVNENPPETIINKITDGQIKGLWIIGEDPMATLPGVKEIENGLNKLDFLIVSDSFLSSTGKMAHVVFPSATFAEKSGTITSMEGLVQQITKAIDCVGESRPDWLTICQIAEHLGAPFNFKSEKEIIQEIIKSVPLYSEMDISAMDNGYFSYKLPVNEKKSKSFFIPEDISGLPAPDKNFPYTLMVGSILFQLGYGHQTKHSPRLSRHIENQYVEINHEDASNEKIQDDDSIKLVSSAGEKKIKARLTGKVPRGILFLPLPFTQDSNLLPYNKEGNRLNTCMIKIEGISS